MLKMLMFKLFLVFCSLEISYAGNISINIETNQELSPHHISISKELTFELLDLSQKSHLAMIKQISNIRPHTFTEKLPLKKELGMANVPVLDQGRHGSCVTFAITAALDALEHLGNHYSQLCFLQLGSYLYQQGLGSSGWDGLSGYTALRRIQTYGLMTIKQEQTYGCGGLKSYPSYQSHSGEMSIDEYKTYAKNPKISYRSIFVKEQDKTNIIKQSLNAGHRVAVGVYLPKADLGLAGAIAWHHYYNDSWVLTEEIKDEIKTKSRFPGHMMLITGYDDNLVAIENNGKAHKGLFILRNSWGKYVGDYGTFYMSYDYINNLAHDAFEIKASVA